MELQRDLYWILKGHSTINCPKEFEREYFLCDESLKAQNFTKNVLAH